MLFKTHHHFRSNADIIYSQFICFSAYTNSYNNLEEINICTVQISSPSSQLVIIFLLFIISRNSRFPHKKLPPFITIKAHSISSLYLQFFLFTKLRSRHSQPSQIHKKRLPVNRQSMNPVLFPIHFVHPNRITWIYLNTTKV